MLDPHVSILITGGNGMLARALLRAASARGFRAVALSRGECDITRETEVRSSLNRHRPSLILNCAAYTAVDRCEADPTIANGVNGDAPGLLAAVAREYDAFLVHYSTDFVFDGKMDRPYRPGDPTNPVNAYGRSKLLGEQAIAANGEVSRFLILRAAWLFGANGNCFPRAILNAARAAKPISVVDDQIGSPTCAVDLAKATLDLLDRGASGTLHVVNRGAASWFELATAITDLFDVGVVPKPISTADWIRTRPNQAARPAYSVLDIGATEQILDRPMRRWTCALRDFRDEVEAEKSG